MVKTDRDILEDLYDYIENEFEYVQRFPEILKANPEAREIKPRGDIRTVSGYRILICYGVQPN